MQGDWEGQPRGKGGLFSFGKMPKNESKMQKTELKPNGTPKKGALKTLQGQELHDFIDAHKKSAPMTRVKLGDFTDERRAFIKKKTGVDAKGAILDSDSVHHAYKKASHNLKPNDLDDMFEIINTTKDVSLSNKKNNGNTVIVFRKEEENGVCFLEEFRSGKGVLELVTAYRPQKERRPQHDGDKIAPGNNVRNGTAPMISIPHSPKKSTPNANNFDGGNTMTTSSTTNRTVLAFMLKQHLATMTPTERGAHKRTKLPRWLYPAATEALYARYYRAWIKPVKEYVHTYIAEHQKAILQGDSTSVIQHDAIPGASFVAMMMSLAGWVAAQFGDDTDENGQMSLGMNKMLRSPVYLGLGDIAESAFNFNSGQWKKSVQYSLGIEFPSDEAWWPVARDTWQKQNYELIKSDIRKYIADINRLTEEAVTNGTGYRPLAEKIQALDDSITEVRSKFIARDQIGKLNGQITQQRMESEGFYYEGERQ